MRGVNTRNICGILLVFKLDTLLCFKYLLPRTSILIEADDYLPATVLRVCVAGVETGRSRSSIIVARRAGVPVIQSKSGAKLFNG